MSGEPDNSSDCKGMGGMVNAHTKSPTNDQTFNRSASFSCPSSEIALQQQISHDSLPRFQLLIRQDPIKGFSAGTDIVARKNARITPLDPPPICELVVVPFGQNDEMDEIERAKYLSTIEVCVHVRLVNVDEPHTEMHDRNLDHNGILLVGNLVESPFIAPCTSPLLKDECFFIFSELSVKCSGQYRLQYDLIDRANCQFRKITSVLGDPFTVYPAKKSFGSFMESTNLMKDIVARGLRLKIYKGHYKNDGIGEEKQQSKKRRKMSDNNGFHIAAQSSLSRPRSISDSINRASSSVEGQNRISGFLAPCHAKSITNFDSIEKQNIPPPLSSSSSSSKSTQKNDSASEAFYPVPSGMPSLVKGRIDSFEESKRQQSDMGWSRRSGEEEEDWQAKQRFSYTPSSYVHDRRSSYNGCQQSDMEDEKRRNRNEYRPLYIGDRYQSNVNKWHTPHIRSLSFRSLSRDQNGFESIKAERWQEAPILPPLRSQSSSQSLYSEEGQRRSSNDFRHDDINQYALSRKYESRQNPVSDYSRRDNF
ncbi:hypothetical protein L7F22_009637 [Adiantum nelumboides]|nr:hypothetical protein [Adiantum nelumboides]